MRDPTGGNVLGFDNVPVTATRLVGFVLAFLCFAGVLWYLISIA